MAVCKLKKGDRIYECRYHETTLAELITDPNLIVRGENSHYWHWKAKVIETNSHNVIAGDIVEFSIMEEAPQYGPRLFRKNIYEVGYDEAEPVLPPFDTSMDKAENDIEFITGLTFCGDERTITCKGPPLVNDLSIHSIGEGMLWIGNGHGPLFFANSYTGKARQLLDENSNLVGFVDRDFDWNKLKSVEHPYDVNHKHVKYGGLGRYDDFRNGVCCLCWMLHPDGRYYADEDGFGMEDDEEENIYCIIDKNLRIVIPWQPMTNGQMNARMREASLKLLLEGMIHGLLKQVEDKVPSNGLFEVVYEWEDVSGMGIGLTHLILKVTKVGVKGSEDKRYLELGAVNYPSPYGAESVVGYGETNDIMLKLKDEALLDTLIEKVAKLAADIEYEERHPWG